MRRIATSVRSKTIVFHVMMVMSTMLALVAFLHFLGPFLAQARVYMVDNTGQAGSSDDIFNFDQALLYARSGDTIALLASPVPYVCPPSGFYITHSVAVVSHDPSGNAQPATFDCRLSGPGRALWFHDVSNVYVRGIRVVGGRADSAPDSAVQAALQGINVTVPAAYGGLGGGILVTYSLNSERANNSMTISVEECSCEDCYASIAGGGVAVAFEAADVVPSVTPNVTIISSNFTRCSGGAFGGGGASIVVGGPSRNASVSLVSCVFTDCNTSGYRSSGGGVHVWHRSAAVRASTRLDGCSFTSCHAVDAGGGLMMGFDSTTQDSLAHITNSTFTDNAGILGGAVCSFHARQIDDFEMTVNSSRIENSFAQAEGGGILLLPYDDSHGLRFRVSDSVFHNNTAVSGGGGLEVFSIGNAYNMSLVFERSIFTNNLAEAGGGLLLVFSQNAVNISSSASDCTFDGNRAAQTPFGFGGGVGVWFSSPAFDDSLRTRATPRLFQDVRLSRLGDSSPQAQHCRLLFTGCKFDHNLASDVGGGLHVTFLHTSHRTHVGISNCHFRHNQAVGLRGGGGVRIWYDAPSTESSVIMSDSEVTDNTGLIGGGILLQGARPDPAYTPSCYNEGCTIASPAFNYSGLLNTTLQACVIRDNIATSDGGVGGGGIFALHTWLALVACRLEGNTAPSSRGGGVAMVGMSSLEFREGHHSADNHAALGGGTVYASMVGPLTVNGTGLIELSPLLSASSTTEWDVATSGFISIGSELAMQCPPGYTMNAPYSVLSANPAEDTIFMSSMVVQCVRCPPLFYTLSAPGRRGPVPEPPANAVQNNTRCWQCPYGTSCVGGGADVMLQDSFWGIPVEQGRVAITRCAPGYCDRKLHPWEESCVRGRGGRLCGKCLPGHSQSLGSGECLPDAECTSGAWFWPVASLIGVLYACFFLLTSPANEGVVKVLVFYGQVLSLLLDRDSKFSIVLGLFNMQLQGSQGVIVCPLPGLTTMGGLFAGYLPAFFVLLCTLVVAALLTSQATGRAFFLRRGADIADSMARSTAATEEAGERRRLIGSLPSISAPPPATLLRCILAAALVRLGLFAYVSFTHTTLQLLLCREVEGVSGQYLLRSAEVRCYTSWQVGLMMVFFLLCIVPGVIWYNVVYRRCQNDTHSSRTWVMSALTSPFQNKYRWWESVLLLQLLFAALCNMAFDEATRGLLFFFFSVTCVSLHLLVQPFRAKATNWLQTLCVLGWLCVSGLDLGPAFLESEAAPNGGDPPIPSTTALKAIAMVIPLVCGLFLLGADALARKTREIPSE